ncbi:MAG: DUF2500 domain-containing protein [Oscillospiraceae bacterium]|nr:DUF2500 domain-containing protein [Oscillospiraceae bacterium]
MPDEGSEDVSYLEYIVAFIFSDGSAKEMPCDESLFNALREGDAGILTNKELENIGNAENVSASRMTLFLH